MLGLDRIVGVNASSANWTSKLSAGADRPLRAVRPAPNHRMRRTLIARAAGCVGDSGRPPVGSMVFAQAIMTVQLFVG